jgi:hypothetical protein
MTPTTSCRHPAHTDPAAWNSSPRSWRGPPSQLADRWRRTTPAFRRARGPCGRRRSSDPRRTRRRVRGPARTRASSACRDRRRRPWPMLTAAISSSSHSVSDPRVREQASTSGRTAPAWQVPRPVRPPWGETEGQVAVRAPASARLAYPAGYLSASGSDEGAGHARARAAWWARLSSRGRTRSTRCARYRLPDGHQIQKRIGAASTEQCRPPADDFTKRTTAEWLCNVRDDARGCATRNVPELPLGDPARRRPLQGGTSDINHSPARRDNGRCFAASRAGA